MSSTQAVIDGNQDTRSVLCDDSMDMSALPLTDVGLFNDILGIGIPMAMSLAHVNLPAPRILAVQATHKIAAAVIIYTNWEFLSTCSRWCVDTDWDAICCHIFRLDRSIWRRSLSCQCGTKTVELFDDAFWRATQNWALSEGFLILQGIRIIWEHWRGFRTASHPGAYPSVDGAAILSIE